MLLTSAGYEFMLFDGLNRFYLCLQRSDLRGRLSCGANCLDDYMTSWEVELRERLERQEALLSQMGQAEVRDAPVDTATPLPLSPPVPGADLRL